MNTKHIIAGVLAMSMLSCSKNYVELDNVKANKTSLATGSLGRVGSATDVTKTTSGGTLLMGGGTDVDAAMVWMIGKAGGGDILVLRSTGTNAYNSYIYGLATCNSVETLLINSTTLANDPQVEAKIRAAEAVFIAGGDQSQYVNYWKNTKVEDALNYLRNTKGCVIGGTSAGNAIQGKYYYSALNASVTSAQALANPYNADVTIGANDFLNNPYLTNLITDDHFNNPDRKGRLLTFLARISKDNNVSSFGVGLDEQTAVAISNDGSSKVFGSGNAYFYKQNTSGPETCISGSSLTWNRGGQAVLSYKVLGNTSGSNTFNFPSWSGTGGSFSYVYAVNGVLSEVACPTCTSTPPTNTAPSALTYATNSLSLTVGSSGSSVTPSISGTTPITYTANVSPANSGIAINANTGVISVDNSVAVGTYAISVNATNTVGTTAFTNVFSVIVNTAGGGSGATPGSLGRVGSANDVTKTTSAGTLLMGGGTDVDAAFQWLINKAGGGDILVLRATGTDAYNDYIYGLGTCNSVETLLLDSRTLANDPLVEAKIRAAEAVFIAGGDQSDYINFWKDTKVEDALNYLRNTKGCVIGGTSAGNAIMGKFYYSAMNNSVTSAQALANPYNSDMTIGANDFISQPFMNNLITDDHLDNPDRRARLLAFMARISKDYGVTSYGIGLDEETAVCIEASGTSKIFGNGYAFFMKQNTSGPETCVSGTKLDWYRSKQAVKVYQVSGTTGGSNTFNLSSWSGTGGSSLYFYSDRGTFRTN